MHGGKSPGRLASSNSLERQREIRGREGGERVKGTFFYPGKLREREDVRWRVGKRMMVRSREFSFGGVCTHMASTLSPL